MQVLLKLSIQRALIGEVTDKLFAVTVGIEEKNVKINAYFSGEVSEDDRERISVVATEVAADLPEGYMVEDESVSSDTSPLKCLDFWAFKRANCS